MMSFPISVMHGKLRLHILVDLALGLQKDMDGSSILC